MTDFTIHHFLFTVEVATPIELDEHSGSALRGSIFEAVWRRFCTNKASPTCVECPLHTVCPVSALVAPLREEHPRGRDIPRPYVIIPPQGQGRRYEAGSQLTFGLTLFGSIVELLPYIMLSAHGLEENGIGRKLKENKGQRGRYTIKQVESCHPFNSQREVIYQSGRPLVNAPTIAVTTSDVAARAETLSTELLALDFLTPTRLTDREKLVHQPVFRPLIQRLSERVAALTGTYGGQDSQSTANLSNEMLQLATGIICTEDHTRWEDVQSYSHRQQRHTPVGGFMGKATFAGDLAPFREMLAWGELIHVGKSAVKGNGWYKIVNS